MRNHLHNPGTTSQRLSINFDLYSKLSNTLWCENEELIVAVKRNLCNCVKKPEKNLGLQRGFNPWPHDTSAMLYQLSYEATDVGSRSIVGSYVPVKEMNVNDIWNKSNINCGNEIKMKKWSSQWEKKFGTSTGFERRWSPEFFPVFFTQLHKLRFTATIISSFS